MRHLDTVDLYMQKEMSMKETGSKTRLMVLEFTHTIMDLSSLEIGFWINSKDSEKNSGQMVHSMKVIIKKV